MAAEAETGGFLQRPWGGDDSLRQRFEAVAPYLAGWSVLDVGCASRFGRPDWVHGLVASCAREAVGIDLDAEKVSAIAATGHDVHVADARHFDLGRTFEVVFAGELIEHLDDVRGFLRSVRRHLRGDGRLVLTTPSTFYLANFVYRLRGSARVHPEHTCWFCASTIRQVLATNGFTVTHLDYVGHQPPTPARRLAAAAAERLLPPALSRDTMLVVAAPAPSP
ncbi:MAG: class I SAM-dependent methyltransferase [Acidimicrobiales bacterium]